MFLLVPWGVQLNGPGDNTVDNTDDRTPAYGPAVRPWEVTPPLAASVLSLL